MVSVVTTVLEQAMVEMTFLSFEEMVAAGDLRAAFDRDSNSNSDGGYGSDRDSNSSSDDDTGFDHNAESDGDSSFNSNSKSDSDSEFDYNLKVRLQRKLADDYGRLADDFFDYVVGTPMTTVGLPTTPSITGSTANSYFDGDFGFDRDSNSNSDDGYGSDHDSNSNSDDDSGFERNAESDGDSSFNSDSKSDSDSKFDYNSKFWLHRKLADDYGRLADDFFNYVAGQALATTLVATPSVPPEAQTSSRTQGLSTNHYSKYL
nr:clumping factor A-like [Setaria viridis]